MPIVKNAIQAVVPRNIIAIATARKTIRSAGMPRPRFSSLGRSTPTWAFLHRSSGRGYVGERRRRKRSRDCSGVSVSDEVLTTRPCPGRP